MFGGFRVFGLFLALFLGGCSFVTHSEHAKAGVVDLRGVDLNQRNVSLDGEWRFQWGNSPEDLILDQPTDWTSAKIAGKSLPYQGNGRYQLRIFFAPSAPHHIILSTKEINSNSKIWLNGTRIPDLGRNRLYLDMDRRSDTLDLMIEVSNQYDIRPGIPCPVYLGNAMLMQKRAELYLGAQALLLGVLCLFTLLYFTSWWMRKKDRASLLLGLNTLCWAVFTFFQGVEASPADTLVPGLALLYQQKAYMVATAFSYPLTCLLWMELFPSRILQRTLPILGIISGIYACVLLVDPVIHWEWFSWYLIVGNVFLMILLWVVAVATKRKEQGALVFLVGLIGFLAMIIYGTVAFRGEWMGAGALILVLADAFLLTRRRADAFDTIEKQRIELVRVNRLKEELATAVKEKFEITVMQERLASLLNLVEAPILVLSEEDYVCYANQGMCDMLGYKSKELEGKSWGSLCVQDQGKEAEYRWITMRTALGKDCLCIMKQVEFSLGQDSLRALFVQGQAPGILVFPNVPPPPSLVNPHALACEIMCLTLEIWEACTGLEKADFAETSGLWKVHADENGWRRALTLDKYLSEDKIPKMPKWRKVIDSARFVLVTCEHRKWKDPRTTLLSELITELTEHLG